MSKKERWYIVARSEFRYNKNRKHYSYLYKDKGDYRYNLLISTKQFVKVKKKKGVKMVENIPLYKHPNPNSDTKVYLVKRRFCDKSSSFGKKLNWKFHLFDKRKVKRLKKKK